jgi:hypothetical protein
MLHGASVKIFPSWVEETTTIDVEWDDSSLSDNPPVGRWAGDLALLAGTGSRDGEWEWDANLQLLLLWVPVPGSARRLIAGLDNFSFPPFTGMTGNGKLQPGLAPTPSPLTFDWESFFSGL